jgi:ribosome-associated protein
VNGLDLTKQLAGAALDKKAKRMATLDLRGLSDICDFVVVCSGDTDRHTRAIADGMEELAKSKYKVTPMAVEGKQSGNWILLDYGSVVVHIFLNELRDYYAVEELWPSAKSVEVNA